MTTAEFIEVTDAAAGRWRVYEAENWLHTVMPETIRLVCTAQVQAKPPHSQTRIEVGDQRGVIDWMDSSGLPLLALSWQPTADAPTPTREVEADAPLWASCPLPHGGWGPDRRCPWCGDDAAA